MASATGAADIELEFNERGTFVGFACGLIQEKQDNVCRPNIASADDHLAVNALIYTNAEAVARGLSGSVRSGRSGCTLNSINLNSGTNIALVATVRTSSNIHQT